MIEQGEAGLRGQLSETLALQPGESGVAQLGAWRNVAPVGPFVSLVGQPLAVAFGSAQVAVPEPGVAVLLGIGLAVSGVRRRRRRPGRVA